MFYQLVGAIALGTYLYSLQKLDKPPVQIVTSTNPWSPSFGKPGSEQPQHRIVERYATIDPATGLTVEVREYENGFRTMVGIGVASTGPDARDAQGPPAQ